MQSAGAQETAGAAMQGVTEEAANLARMEEKLNQLVDVIYGGGRPL